MTYRQIRTIISLIFCLSTVTIIGQSIEVETQLYNEENGLSSYANYIHKDSRGQIWIGTQFGLYRFDGRTFVHFDENDGLPFRQIMEIYEDETGWFWLYKNCYGKGETCKKDLAFFHPITKEIQSFQQRFGTETDIKPQQIEGILVDSLTIYLTANHNLLSWNAKQGLRVKSIQGIDNEYTPYLFSKLKPGIFVALESCPTNRVERDYSSLTIDTNGVVISYAPTKNVPFKFTQTFQSLAINSKPFSEVRIGNQTAKIDQEGNISLSKLLISMPRLGKDVEGTWKFYEGLYFTNDQGQLFNSDIGILEDLKANYKAQERPGESEYKDFAWVKYNSSAFPSFPFQQHNHNVRHNYYDLDNQVSWNAHRYGIMANQYETKQFGHIGSKKRAQLVFGADADEQGNAYLKIGDWLFHSQIKHGKAEVKPAFTEEQPKFLFLAQENQTPILWGARIGQLAKMNPAKQTIQYFPKKDLANFGRLLVEDEKVWICNGTDLIYFDVLRETFHEFEKNDLFVKDSINWLQYILPEDAEHFWLVSSKYLYFASKTKGFLVRYGLEEDPAFRLPVQRLNHLSKAKDGGYWLSTLQGLIYFKLDQEQIVETQLFNKETGLSNQEILSAFEDHNGFLWLPTPNGLIQLKISNGLSRTYYKKDGLSSAGFSDIEHCWWTDSILLLGGNQGFNYFKPSDFKEVELEPQVQLIITAFERYIYDSDAVEDRLWEITQNGNITLQPGDKFFSLGVALANYRDAKRHRFAYKIEGYQESWQEGYSNLIRISGLPYGNYTLKIKGRLANNLYAKPILEIPILVLKPFYLQNWFFISCTFLLCLSIFSFYYLRTRQLKERQKELEQSIKAATFTIEQQNQELKKLDKVKSRFFANVSHELRTPLTLMLAPIDSAINNNRLANRDFTLLKLAQQNGRTLLKLINEILSLTKLENKKMELQEENVLLYNFLNRLLANFESIAKIKAIELRFDYQPSNYLHLKLDTEKVEKILNNLLANALKFTPAGQSITLYTQAFPNCIQIKVIDTGLGISTADLPHIFDRFYQAKQTNTPASGGTGIGLALSKALAKLMDGKLWAESKLGAGSTFCFEFPLKKILSNISDEGAQEIVNWQKGVQPEGASILNKELIEVRETAKSKSMDTPLASLLIVEDNPDLSAYLQLILSSHYQVFAVENGQVALEWLKAQHQSRQLPDLIISDMMMPIIDGIQLLKELKNTGYYRAIPVIMLTARAELTDKLEALRVGVDDYITKPFIEAELLARIANLLTNAKNRKSTVLTSLPEAFDDSISLVSQKEQEWLGELEKKVTSAIPNFDFTIDQLAIQMTMSNRSLQYKIKKLTGLSPRGYIQEIRFTQARELLVQQKKSSVKAIAYEVGLKDVAHFSKVFKERFGRLPSSYI